MINDNPYFGMTLEEHLELADKFEFQQSENAFTKDGKPSRRFLKWVKETAGVRT